MRGDKHKNNMQTRSKVAAAAASVVPFHCVICFDEFNLKERTPMVLPCGHTYVCLQCTKRLKRCMECREPLFISAAPKCGVGCSSSNGALHLNNHHSLRPGVGSVASRYATAGGSNHSPNQHGSVGAPQMSNLHLPPSQMGGGGGGNSGNNANTIPLPIPKNVVLIAMMEAAQRQSQEQEKHNRKAGRQPGGADDGDSSSDEEDDEEEEYNLDRIISGMATLSGPCGTYSVADPSGLEVLPVDPRKKEQRDAPRSAREQKHQVPREPGRDAGSERENQRPPRTPPSSSKRHAASPSPRNSSPVLLIKDAVTVEEEKKVEVERDESAYYKFGGPEMDDQAMELDLELNPLPSTTGSSGEYLQQDEDDNRSVSSTDANVNFSPVKPYSENDEGDGQEGHQTPPPPPTLPPRSHHLRSRRLKKGQIVQVVDFQDGVAKLARGQGFIVAKSSQLVKVGGPREACCRLEGLLDTIESRGKDLQSTLDENRQIEDSLRKQIQAELEKEPSHPVIVEPPELDLTPGSKSSDTSQPSTPTGDDRHKENMHTPDKMALVRDNSLTLPSHGTPTTIESENGGRHRGNAHNGTPNPSYPRSPNSIDNADIERAGIPGYRRAVSEDDLDHLAFGCGAAFLGQSSGLFAETWNPRMGTTLLNQGETSSELGANGPARLRPRTLTDQLIHATPTLTSSFDGVDFRTGLSGHRGLNNVHSKATHSPTPRGRQIRFMMSEHRGIGRIRPTSSRSTNSPTGQSAQQQQYQQQPSYQYPQSQPVPSTASSSGPSFLPRFSPFPGHE